MLFILFDLWCSNGGSDRDRGKEKERDDSHENLIDWGNLFEFPQLVFAAWDIAGCFKLYRIVILLDISEKHLILVGGSCIVSPIQSNSIQSSPIQSNLNAYENTKSEVNWRVSETATLNTAIDTQIYM